MYENAAMPTAETAEMDVADSPIRDASQGIGGQLNELEATVTHLEKRLDHVMRSHEYEAAVVSEKLLAVPNADSQHAVELRKHADFVRQLQQRLASVLSRLDV